MTSTELSIHTQPVTKTLSVCTQCGFKGRVHQTTPAGPQSSPQASVVKK